MIASAFQSRYWIFFGVCVQIANDEYIFNACAGGICGQPICQHSCRLNPNAIAIPLTVTGIRITKIVTRAAFRLEVIYYYQEIFPCFNIGKSLSQWLATLGLERESRCCSGDTGGRNRFRAVDEPYSDGIAA